MKPAIRVEGRTGTANNPTVRFNEWGTSPSWTRSVTVEPHDFSPGRMSERVVYDRGDERRDVSDEYCVAIKPSAWKRSRAVGAWVNREGPRRVFASKALAREWARDCAGHGVTLWVQDAPAWDPDAVDGYLVGSARGSDRSRRPGGSQQSLGDAADTPD